MPQTADQLLEDAMKADRHLFEGTSLNNIADQLLDLPDWSGHRCPKMELIQRLRSEIRAGRLLIVLDTNRDMSGLRTLTTFERATLKERNKRLAEKEEHAASDRILKKQRNLARAVKADGLRMGLAS